MSATGVGGAPVLRADRAVGTTAVVRWELGKLAALRRTQAVLGICVAAPLLFVVVSQVQSGVPRDTLFGRWVHESGFATPLVILGFAGQWGLPLLVAVVAGDTFSSEDHFGTWKTVLTRSAGRRQLFAGKVAAVGVWSVVVVAVLAVSSVVAGLLTGHQAVVGLSGQLLPAGRALPLVLASWATVLPPVLGYAAVGVLASVWSRSSVAGVGAPVVLGLLLQLVTLVNAPPLLSNVLLSGATVSWHGFWVDPSFAGPWLEGLAASTAWVLACVGGAWTRFARHDVAVG